jgi:choloylglycine hydrolase
VPWGVGDPEHPNLSPTYWRSVADSTSKVYYFESALSPNIVWVNLNNINFAPGSGVRAVAVEENYSIIGNIDKELKPAAPIRFLAPPANPPAGAAPSATGPDAAGSDATGLAEPAKKTFGWWWIPIGLAVVAVVGALIRPLSRRPVEAATLAATRAPITPVPPAPPISPEPTISDRQSSAADASSIQVTYENNALGDGEQSGTDKSDSVPD